MMSAKIAQEPVSVGITLNPQFTPDVKNDARPVESIGQSTADPKGNNPRESRDSEGRLTRPPGKDPSIPPQALFDAALIAAENKPNVEIVKVEIEQAEMRAAPEKIDQPGEIKTPTSVSTEKQAQPVDDTEPADAKPETIPLAYFGADPELKSI